MEPEDIAQSFRILRKSQNKLNYSLIFFYQRTEINAKQTTTMPSVIQTI